LIGVGKNGLAPFSRFHLGFIGHPSNLGISTFLLVSREVSSGLKLKLRRNLHLRGRAPHTKNQKQGNGRHDCSRQCLKTSDEWWLLPFIRESRGDAVS
jgi:hypothetical protein